MRVMQVMAGAQVGGIETFFFDAVTALAEAGLDQHVVVRPIAATGIGRLTAAGIPLTTTEFSHWWPWSSRRVIAGAAAAFAPDIIQYWTGRAASFAPRTRAVQVGWYGGYRRRKDYRSCSEFIAITPDLVRHIKGQGIADAHVALIHIFTAPRRAAPASRAELGTPADAPLLLALARLHPHKALDVLLQALAEVPGAYLWIAGEGPQRHSLEALCRRLGLGDRVRFLGWRDDRDALLAACDICVFPSREEPFGAVTIEAWAASKPLVAAAAQGPAAYVDSGRNGLLVPVDDAPALAAALRNMIEAPGLQAKFATEGRRDFETKFTKEVYVREMLEFYGRIVGRGEFAS